MTRHLTIVGAGVTGLVAAVAAAERGWQVTVTEAHSTPGGRARTLASPFRANLGPHALYTDGPLWSWLQQRALIPPVAAAPDRPTMFRIGDRIGPWSSELGAAIAALPAEADPDESFRQWLHRYVDAAVAEAIIGLVFIVTYDHDPGRLSADFMRERLRRGLAGSARYVVGGWSSLVEVLVGAAEQHGVHIQTGARIASIPAGPAVVATSLAAARRLTGDRSLEWPGTRTATFDLGVSADAGVDWFRLFDLDDRVYLARYSMADSTLAPSGNELVQIAAAHHPGEHRTQVEQRVERLLDRSWPGWRDRVRWRRASVRVNCTGAVDLPGTTWRDRPPVCRSASLGVATDQSAAPGILAEIGVTAAQLAVDQLSE